LMTRATRQTETVPVESVVDAIKTAIDVKR
jgi:hypothetical protein